MYEFIDLYDAAPIFSLKGLSLEEMYEKLGLDGRRSMVRSKVYETVRERLFALLSVDDKNKPHVSFSELAKCREYWFYQEHLNNTTKYKPYIFAITRLKYSFGSRLKYLIPFSEKEKWGEAMRLLKCLMEDGHDLNYDVNIAMERQIDRVKAIKRLKRYGLQVGFDDVQKELVFGDLMPIYRKISAIIEKVGGSLSIVTLLKHHTYYNSYHHRFTQKRQGNRLGAEKPEMEVPVAYLMNLAFNKLSYKGNVRYAIELEEAERLARDVCAIIHETQTYTIWEDIFYDREHVDDYLRRLVIWDSIYTIPQCSPLFVKDLMTHLVNEYEKLGYEVSDKYTLQDYFRFMEYMMNRTQIGFFTQMRFAKVQRELDMPEVKLRAIWSDVTKFTGSVRYTIPLDFDYMEIYFQPAFLLPNKDILLYPASLGAMGWYEVFLRELRGRNKEVDNKAGDMLESFLHKQFTQHGIPSKTGKYVVKKKIQGDCDAAIEDDKYLLLMELKKKTMTRKAKEGHVYQIILDFAAGLFIPQVQAFKTETLLTENGKISLNKDGRIDELEKRNKQIEKLAVALNDYGTLHEQVILERVLDIFLRCSFDFNEQEIRNFLGDAKIADEVMQNAKKLQDRQKDIHDYVNRLMAMQPEMKPDRIFFNSGFFSLEQLYFLLTVSSGAKDYIDKVRNMKYTSFGTKDFWAEVDAKLNLQTKRQEV